MKSYLSYLYYHLKQITRGKNKLPKSLESLDELQEKNIVGYRTAAGIKKLTIRHINAKARKEKFVLNHSYKKELIYDDGNNIVRIPLELPHLLNMNFKKDEHTDAYTKEGITVLFAESFFIIKDDIKLDLKYINSLQNYCSIIRNDRLDFSLVL